MEEKTLGEISYEINRTLMTFCYGEDGGWIFVVYLCRHYNKMSLKKKKTFGIGISQIEPFIVYI